MMEDSQLWYDGLPVFCTNPANYHVFFSWRCVAQQYIAYGSKSLNFCLIFLRPQTIKEQSTVIFRATFDHVIIESSTDFEKNSY